MQWEAVIGLEIHVQLATKTKIFSGSSTAFGAEPNTQASLIDLSLPGTLPVVNQEAVNMAIKFGLAINSQIPKSTYFERKNYFYPDLPNGYQTSQMFEPIVGAGFLDITLEDGSSKRIDIHHAHLEEDAGKSLHEDFDGMTGIDLNRAGTPLLEIVTQPVMSNAKEAVAFMREIHALVTYLGISDGNLAEGSLRCDANVSVRPQGQAELGTRCEIKNINSFRFIERAINYEIERQIEVIEDGGSIVQQTRLYDADADATRAMRDKGDADDYRYFTCPNIPPISLSKQLIESLQAQLPELPAAKRKRFQQELELSAHDAELLTASRELAAYFEEVAELSSDAKLAANWVNGELAAQLNKTGLELAQAPITPAQLAGLVLRVKDQTINSKAAKEVFAALWNKQGADADAIIAEKGLKQVTDTGALNALVAEVISNNPKQVANYVAAEEDKRAKMLGFFVGQLMKATKGTANPQLLNQLLNEQLSKLV